MRQDHDFEEDRILQAYLKKNKIDWRTVKSEDWHIIRQDALLNSDLYPIPITESEYLYHGTAKTRLPNILNLGLIPAERSRWQKDPFIGGWSIGKVFLCDTIHSAEFYATQASKNHPVILRVLKSNLSDLKIDLKEKSGHFYVDHIIDPGEIEVWNGKQWKEISVKTIELKIDIKF